MDIIDGRFLLYHITIFTIAWYCYYLIGFTYTFESWATATVFSHRIECTKLVFSQVRLDQCLEWISPCQCFQEKIRLDHLGYDLHESQAPWQYPKWFQINTKLKSCPALTKAKGHGHIVSLSLSLQFSDTATSWDVVDRPGTCRNYVPPFSKSCLSTNIPSFMWNIIRTV